MNDAFQEMLKKSKRKPPNNIELIKASDVEAKEKQWLWTHHLLRGALELLSGLPNLGKSQVQISLVACVTAGLPWPDGAEGMDPANVIMLTAEDTVDQEVVPRLVAAGANLDRVHIVKCIKTDEKNRQFLLGEDLEALEKKISEIGDMALITIDPITAYMGGKIDSHKSTEVRQQLGPLKDFAERTNVAISAITHPPKSSSQKAIDHFIGSQAFIAAGRIAHVCIEEMDDDGNQTGRILFTHAKWNPTTRQPTQVYSIEEVRVRVNLKTFPIDIPAPHVVWGKDSIDITADEAVRAAAGGGAGKQRGQQNEVQDFLKYALKSCEPVSARGVIEEATKRGFTYEQLRTARKKLGVVAEQKSGGGGWAWQMAIPF